MEVPSKFEWPTFCKDCPKQVLITFVSLVYALKLSILLCLLHFHFPNKHPKMFVNKQNVEKFAYADNLEKNTVFTGYLSKSKSHVVIEIYIVRYTKWSDLYF